MPEGQEKPDLPPKDGLAQRIRKFLEKSKRPHPSPRPPAELGMITEQTLESIQPPDFGVKGYLLEAAKRGHSVTERKVGAYTLLQVTTPTEWGGLDRPNNNGGRETEVTVALMDGKVMGGRSIHRITKGGRKIKAISVGIPADMVMGYHYEPESILQIYLGGVNEITTREILPATHEIFRMVGYGGYATNPDVEIRYGLQSVKRRQSQAEYSFPDSFTFNMHSVDELNPRVTIFGFDSTKAAVNSYGNKYSLPFGYEGKTYDYKKTPEGLLMFSRESSDGTVRVKFPKDVREGIPTDSLETTLQSDTEWLKLPRLMPISFSRTAPPPQK